jgi:alpha-galactosidase
MQKIIFAFIVVFLQLETTCATSPFAKWTKTELVLNNGIVQRIIQLPSAHGNLITSSYKPNDGDFRYFSDRNPDFQFELNEIVYSGKSNWSLVDIHSITDTKQGDGAAVILISEDKKVELTLKYLLYPGSPAIRKSLIVKNIGHEPVKLESVDIEKFEVTPYYPVTFSWIYHDYGRRCSIGPYEGSNQDALIIVHNMNW